MTREEAIKIFSGIASLAKINTEPTMSVCNVKNEVFTEILQALLVPQPDPITGLVPCGCGGKAIMLCDLEYAVACEKCLINLPYAFDTKELARQAWNTAMCYTAPPRPGAFGPEQDRTAPIGDKGAGE